MTDKGSIKVKYVQRQKAADGSDLLYFRKGGYREGPLRSAFGTQALQDEVTAIVERINSIELASSTPRAGTVGGMLKAYAKSSDFLGLAARTRAGYQDYIDEQIEDIGDVLLSSVTRSWIMGLRDAWAIRGHNSANKRMQVLKNALKPAILDETDSRISGDPFHKIPKVKRPHEVKEANPRWEDHEVIAGIEDAIERGTPGLARAIALGRYGGFRRGTICNLPLHARTVAINDQGEQERRLYWLTEKRIVLADKREDARLTEVIERTPNRALTVAYNADGAPWKERQLNQAVERLMDRLAKNGKVRAAVDAEGNVYCPLTLHGLRHARGVELALAGASDSEIMSQLEQASEAAAKIYRRQANRRRMADAAQDKIDNVVSLKAKKRAQEP
ncbi:MULTISPECIES: site-specific integrase [unclassified Brevundimonas]|uniref:site-specific integrase n=1 Tax=unclassified Brevundimonas TaxID=2622653 RepID=UPI0025C5F155|nr:MULTISPECIES: site-specific integrase [unclassified Brevundimonas]